MKDVLIDILGTQILEDGSPEELQLTTIGKLGERDGKLYLFYDEPPEDFGSPVTTVLKIQGEDSITLQRSGGSNTRLIITRGRREQCRYHTPYGDMTIGVYGEQMENRLTPSGGWLTLEYTLDANLALLSKNRLKITVKEARK